MLMFWEWVSETGYLVSHRDNHIKLCSVEDIFIAFVVMSSVYVGCYSTGGLRPPRVRVKEHRLVK